jgi:hypothetical protein
MLALLWIVSPLGGLDGCEVDADLGPEDVGVRAGGDGTIDVLAGPCTSLPYRSVRLTTPDGGVLWQADQVDPNADDQAARSSAARLSIGRAPAGFTDVVPLAGPLDPAATYTVALSTLAAVPGAPAVPSGDPGSPPDEPTTTSADLYAALGARTTFRPADLDTAAVWFRAQSVSPAEFERLVCEPAPSDDA